MSIAAELEAIRDADPNHILHPKDVVAYAQTHTDSLLHGSFQWDIEKAAYAHWLWQARQLIKLHIRDDRGDPKMVSLQIDRVAGGGYRKLDTVMATPDLRAMALAEALAELRRVQRRYTQLRELEGVWAALDEAEDKAKGFAEGVLEAAE